MKKMKKKKTKTEIANERGISLKTLKNESNFRDDMNIILEGATYPEKVEFWNLIEKVCVKCKDKKRKVSREMIHQLALKPKEDRKKAVKDLLKFKQEPENIKEYFCMMLNPDIKLTTTVPYDVNLWLMEMAEKEDVTKSDFVKQVLVDYFNKSKD